MNYLIAIGAIAIGMQFFLLLRSARKTVEKPSIDEAFKNIASTVDDIKQKVDALEEPVHHAIHGADDALVEAKITMQKVQEVADNFNGLIETVELKPVRRKVKKILSSPFKCFRAPKVES